MIILGQLFWSVTQAGSAPPASDIDLGVRRRRKVPQDEIEREQRMVQEYLESLEPKPQPMARAKPRELQPSVLAPAFTAAMAKVASDEQLQRVIEAAADAHAREIAQAEHRKRYWAAFITLAMN